MVWTLDWPFATAAYSYRLTSDYVQFDNNGFTGLHAEGAGRLSPWPMRVPIRLAAKAITGIGDLAGAMLANPQIEGWLSVTPKLVQGQDLRLTSAKWNGKLSLLIDLVTGRFDVSLSGAMQRYLIPGIGIVDVTTDLKVIRVRSLACRDATQRPSRLFRKITSNVWAATYSSSRPSSSRPFPRRKANRHTGPQ